MKELDYIVGIRCPFCNKVTEVAVNFCDYMAWENGALAQNVFPYLSPIEREVLISGICPSCQDSVFGCDDDEDEDEDWDDEHDLDLGFDVYEGCYTYDC